MGILPLILVIIVVGIAFSIWPIDGTLKKIIYGLIAIMVVVVIFNLIGGMGGNGWWCYPRCNP